MAGLGQRGPGSLLVCIAINPWIILGVCLLAGPTTNAVVVGAPRRMPAIFGNLDFVGSGAAYLLADANASIQDETREKRVGDMALRVLTIASSGRLLVAKGISRPRFRYRLK